MYISTKIALFILYLFFIGCATRPSIITITKSKNINIAINVNTVKLMMKEKTQDRIVKTYFLGGLHAVLFPSPFLKKEDLNTITNTLKKTIEKNNLNNKNSNNKYTLFVEIINYFRLDNFRKKKRTNYICAINFKLIDKKNNISLDRDFFLLYDHFFKSFSGNLKALISEAITYRILNEIIYKLSKKEVKLLNKYKNVLFFNTIDEAIKNYNSK